MIHIGVEFEGFVTSVDVGDDLDTSDADIIAAAREDMIDQIRGAPDFMFTIEDRDDK